MRVLPPTPDHIEEAPEGPIDNIPASIEIPQHPVGPPVADLSAIIDDIVVSMSVGRLEAYLFGADSPLMNVLKEKRSYSRTINGK